MTHSLIVGLLAAGAVLAAAVLVGVALVWWNQERLAFQPPRPVALPLSDRRVRRVTYAAADGQELAGYLVGVPSAVTPLVVAFHGNADLAEWMVPWALELHVRTRAVVLLPEYRGYGTLSGHPTYLGARADARAALAYLRTLLGGPPARLVLFGHSLGSAIAAELAETAHPAAVALQSPFTSARAMAARLFFPTFGPVWRWLSRVHYDTPARVAGLDVPVHVAHGVRDRVVPVVMGRAVFAAARRPGVLLLVPDAGHNDVPEVAAERYWQWLVRAVLAGAVPPNDD